MHYPTIKSIRTNSSNKYFFDTITFFGDTGNYEVVAVPAGGLALRVEMKKDGHYMRYAHYKLHGNKIGPFMDLSGLKVQLNNNHAHNK
jgi:hypothetical protein